MVWLKTTASGFGELKINPQAWAAKRCPRSGKQEERTLGAIRTVIRKSLGISALTLGGFSRARSADRKKPKAIFM